MKDQRLFWLMLCPLRIRIGLRRFCRNELRAKSYPFQLIARKCKHMTRDWREIIVTLICDKSCENGPRSPQCHFVTVLGWYHWIQLFPNFPTETRANSDKGKSNLKNHLDPLSGAKIMCFITFVRRWLRLFLVVSVTAPSMPIPCIGHFGLTSPLTTKS